MPAPSLSVFIAAVACASVSPAWAVDIANLPMLKDGDISISNDLDHDFSVDAEPRGCGKVRVVITAKKASPIRCAGATSVRVWYQVRLADGKVSLREQSLQSNTHYTLGWADDIKTYGQFIPVFGPNGLPSR